MLISLSRFFQDFFRIRLAHSALAMALISCLFASQAGASDCAVTCAFNENTSERQSLTRTMVMEEDCCGGTTGTMSCCSSTSQNSDQLADTDLKLQLRNFTLVLPTIDLERKSTAMQLKSPVPADYERLLTAHMTSTKLYILNRSLLI